MIKTVAYFPEQCAKNAHTVFSAVLDCLQANGIQTCENSMDAEAAVIWSVLWHGRMKANQAVYNHYRAQGKPVIVIEIGALYRGQTWKIAVNNINAEGYYGHLDHLDMDRPSKLRISLATQIQPKPNIVLALQHSRSQQVAKIADMTEWIQQTVSLLRNNTDRPITIRPHPRCNTALPPLPLGVIIEQPRPVAGTYDSFNMHFDCHAVVNYNSGPGIQAAIAGVRPVVDFTSLAYPVSVGYADIEQPYKTDRQLWLAQICHTEYTLDELRKGLWLERIAPALDQ